MAVKIRLMRIGKKKAPKYRVIVIDEHKKRNSRYLEQVGFYDPIQNPPQFTLKQDRVDAWIKNGAQYSEGMRKILVNQRVPKKKPEASTKKVTPIAKSTKPKKQATKIKK